ncbi:hypothetical protein PCO86_08800 [Pectobacteriaceae bacterium CE70]|uniref:hypothetical protein n=1 Tax=Serratia sp. (strain ATCC 39006) TaxID=104623 RepID=UPI00039277CF|nr:hypothetical protein [Serratia sp. ATCC 39006]WJV64061.1 hypothetical protein PCO87_08580 [Pectobacteriaceae bacterium C52]WJV68473.1 hypothetical protein PCO86_08800 [Pectobacteriaceae bacterium CE70]WJY12403.1 hypothetical protein PCO80_08650 [Pectobacteriaceae bacterium C80]
MKRFYQTQDTTTVGSALAVKLNVTTPDLLRNQEQDLPATSTLRGNAVVELVLR